MAGSQDDAATSPITANPARERKIKALRDFVRKEPTESGTSTGQTPLRSITTSAKSGQLVLDLKKRKKANLASRSHLKGHEILKEKLTHARLSRKVLPQLRTPGGAELGDMTRFVQAWNNVDCPKGPSLTRDILKGIEHSVSELQEQLEVIYFYHFMFICHT